MIASHFGAAEFDLGLTDGGADDLPVQKRRGMGNLKVYIWNSSLNPANIE
jgi:hypothetical protein